MHRRRFWAAALLVAGLATVCVADWTSFRGPNFNGITDEKVAWPAGGPRQLWKAPCGEGFGTMAVAGGKVFVTAEGGGQEALLALDAKDGSAKWHYVMGRTIYDRQGGNGPRTTPAVDGKLVFAYGTFLNLVCCDAESGKFLWGHDVAKEFGGDSELTANDIKTWGNAASPVFDDKCVIVYGGGNGQSFIGFDKQTGNVVWKAGNEHLTHSSPTIATIHGVRQIIFLTKSGLVSLATADGKELWRFPFKFNISTASSPVVGGKDGDVVYCTAGYKVGAAAARIAKDGERFTATQIWRNDDAQLLAQHWSSSVYKDGYLYGIFGWARPGDAPLKCVELESGKVMWEKPGFGFGGTILAGDTLVVQGSAGQVAFVKPTPQGYQAVGGGNVFQNAKCWNAAVVSNGRLYARTTKQNSRDQGSIVCLDVSAGR